MRQTFKYNKKYSQFQRKTSVNAPFFKFTWNRINFLRQSQYDSYEKEPCLSDQFLPISDQFRPRFFALKSKECVKHTEYKFALAKYKYTKYKYSA